MKRYFFAMIIAVVGIMPTTAQTGNESFDEFRRSINRDFQSFRKKVLDDYADFLDGVWKEYNAFTGTERDSVPKPSTQPVAPGATPKPKKPSAKPTPKPKAPKQEAPKQENPKPSGDQDLSKYDIPQLDFSGIGTSKKEEPKQEEPKKEKPIKDEPKKTPVPQQPKKENPENDTPKAKEPKKEVPQNNEPKKEKPIKETPKQEKPVKDEPKEAPITQRPKKEVPKQEEPKTEESKQEEVTTPQVPQPVVPAIVNKKYMYHSIAVEVPPVVWGILPAGTSAKDIAKLWRSFSSLKVEKTVLPAIIKVAGDCKLNDWLLCECIRSYVDNEMATMQPGQRMALTHYLLAHAGFDVRIGLTSTQEPLLLIALQQDIYARSFTTLNNTKYYIFFDNLAQRDDQALLQFFTCEIPTDVDCGKHIDLLIQEEPNIPYEAHTYSFSHDGMHIEGEVNANLMPMLYRYPQMEMGYFAQSVVSARTQESIARQIATQLESLPEREAVDKLLQFVQSAFDYATDGEQHGFEKPYFFEEMLYYPQCDCEDRSMFYSYLLKMVLGVENHVISFPGHESVSVNLGTTISGHGYEYDKKHFYISDPTYIGATTGMCMPNYQNVTPEIDFKR